MTVLEQRLGVYLNTLRHVDPSVFDRWEASTDEVAASVKRRAGSILAELERGGPAWGAYTPAADLRSALHKELQRVTALGRRARDLRKAATGEAAQATSLPPEPPGFKDENEQNTINKEWRLLRGVAAELRGRATSLLLGLEDAIDNRKRMVTDCNNELFSAAQRVARAEKKTADAKKLLEAARVVTIERLSRELTATDASRVTPVGGGSRRQ